MIKQFSLRKYAVAFVYVIIIATLIVITGQRISFSQILQSQSTALTSRNPDKLLQSDTVAIQLTDEEQAWLREHPVITVVQDSDYPPVEFADKNGNPTGLTNDYLELIEKRINFTFKRSPPMDWRDAYRKLQSWEIDMTTSVTETDSRKAFWIFTKSYIKIPLVILTHSDVSYIGDMKDLTREKIAVVDGYAVAEWIAHDYPDITLVKVATVKEGLHRLQNRDVFCFIENMLVISYYLRTEKITNLKIAGTTPYKNHAVSMAVRKDWPMLAQILNKALASITEAERNTLYNKWVPIRYEIGVDYRLLWRIVIVFTLFVAMLIFWNNKLRSEIQLRKKAEVESDKNHLMLDTVLKGTPNAIYIKDLESRMLLANAATIKSFGQKESDIIGKTDYEYIDDKETAASMIHNDTIVMDCGETRIFEERLKTPDGERVFLSTKTPFRDAQGKTIGIFGISQDITTLKQTEERLAVTLRSIGDGVITTDINGTIVMINKVAETLTGWESGEACGEPLVKIFNTIDSQNRQPCENFLECVVKTGVTIERSNQTSLVSRDGSEIAIAESAAPMLDNEGHCIGVVLVFRDMTEKQKLDESMQRAQKLESLGVLAGGIAHDFNNLLGGIFGYIDLTSQTVAEGDLEKSGLLIEKTLGVLERAQALTHQLLTFSKGGAPIRTTVQLAPFIKKNVQFALSGSNVACEFTIADTLWPCKCDENQIGQVLDNIVINAKQAMVDGGTIFITAENMVIDTMPVEISNQNNKYVKISIKDQGPGIPKELQSKIFDPFFSTKKNGHGLGLSTVFSIVQRHDGWIDLESHPGNGATFSIYIPASESKQEENKPPMNETHQNGKTILVMDDEEFMLEIVSEMLEMLGHKVIQAKNGDDAVTIFQNSTIQFSACLLDLTIPGGMGGVETAEKLRNLKPDITLIAMSGYSEDPVMSNPDEHGFKDRLVKPFRKADLVNMLKRVFPN